MNDKYLLITVDTEGDSQWDTSAPATTNNIRYLPRFQMICEKYGFVPTWLSNYEAVCDPFFVGFFSEKQNNGLCEIGMHLHAWNSPPSYPLSKKNDQREYLYEYPLAIMESKVSYLTDLIEERFGIRPISHRGGRWGMNREYFGLLNKYGYKVDCSITPGVNWTSCKGSTGVGGPDYSYETSKASILEGILELPMTIRHMRCFQTNRIVGLKSFAKELKNYVVGDYYWLRPDKYLSDKAAIRLLDVIATDSSEVNYAMFMIHSSELMIGGSPSFKTDREIESLYTIIDNIFFHAYELGFKGISLRKYYSLFKWTIS